MDINYNKWKEEEHYAIKHQLMYEAERELLRREDMGDTDFLYVGDIFVGTVAKDHEAKLRLYQDSTHAILITKGHDLIAHIFFKDLEASDS